MNYRNLILALSLCPALLLGAKDVSYNSPGAGNPIIPGYFADPTVKKFGDTYYIYATTDGSGAGFGPAQLWQSKDFKNWTLMPMNWPDSHWIWAPDVMKNDSDGKYYYVYCQPCKIHVGVGDTPRGPWKNVLGESEAVLVPDRFVTNAITLDGQTFTDDDGSIYMYWGTWGIYPGFGCGAGKLNPDMKGFSETRLIPNTEVTDFFEAPFVFKRNGIYYFLYSCEHCEDASYHVRYATSDKPLGPYTFRGTILKTNEDGTIHGPGHNSVMKEGDNYYIVYHRHDNPHSNRGFHRQIAIDRLEFDSNGLIKPVVPTHSGVEKVGKKSVTSRNIAFGKSVKASSYYNDDFRPAYAVDDNNGTIWKAKTMGQEWIEIDLGKVEPVRTVWTQWEYGTHFYRYLVETSVDGKNWTVFSDKRKNRLAGSPMVDFGDTEARYVRILFTGCQKAGFPAALWNVKVFSEVEDSAPQQWVLLNGLDWNGREWENSLGQLGGKAQIESGNALMTRTGGQEAVRLDPGTRIVFSNPMISPDREHTAHAAQFDGKEWKPFAPEIEKGKLIVESGSDTLYVNNVRYYNWRLEDVEKNYDVTSPVARGEVSTMARIGKVVHIDASEFNDNDTVPYIENKGIAGYFEMAADKPLVVRTVEGRKAFAFDNGQVYHSSFMLPASVRDNAPYTIDAWVLNPEIELNECVADFTSSHDELEKIMLVNGTEPRCGVINHYGWYEDAGNKNQASLAGKWQHLYICFDGRMESVYINDELISRKDIQLLVKPSQRITLGRNAEGEWLFNGYLGSLKFFDEYIPYK